MQGLPRLEAMMRSKFKVGDLVQLKSGGPIMTVIESLTEHDLTCRWFNATHNDKTATFHTNTLKSIEDGRPLTLADLVTGDGAKNNAPKAGRRKP